MNLPCTYLYLESLVWSQSNFSPLEPSLKLYVKIPSQVPRLQCGHKAHLSGSKHVFHKVLQQLPPHRFTGLLAMPEQYMTAVQKSTSQHFSVIEAWCKPGTVNADNFIVGKDVMWTYGPSAIVDCNKSNPGPPLFEQHQLLLQAHLVSSSVWVYMKQCSDFM